MAIKTPFADIRMTEPISFSVYRNCFCFIGKPMKTENPKDGEIAPQRVRAYLMCDETDRDRPLHYLLKPESSNPRHQPIVLDEDFRMQGVIGRS